MTQSHSSHAGLLATPGPPLVHDGRTYRCAPLDQDHKAELERRLISRAMSAAALAPAELRGEACAAVAADAAGGSYGFYGARSQAALGSRGGAVILTALLFGCTESEAFGLLEARPEAQALVDLAVLESLPEAARQRVLAARQQAREASEEARPTKADEEAA